MSRYKVVFKPGDLVIEVVEGSSVMDAIHEAGLDVDFPCGGRGRCGKCRVKILTGGGEPTTGEKELLDSKDLQEGIRLACLTQITGNMVVEVPAPKKLQHNILLTSEDRSFRIQPHLKKMFIQIEPPSLHDHRPDWQRLKDSLSQYGYNHCEPENNISLLRQLPETLRKSKHSLTAVLYGNKLLGIEEQDTTGTMLGMAFDIGTTTIVGYLLDLYTGKELSVVSTLNPQTKFGADVISRVNFTIQEADGLRKLHAAVIEAINDLIGEGAEKAGVSRNQIYGVSIAANTCMHHLFLGISPRYIAVSPYVAAVSEPLVINATELDIDINQAGKIFVLPNIAGFVGADTTAVLLATELDQSEEVKLVIDIGTNGEIVLGSKEKVVACSAAAGPAFEGAQISSGMRGAEGAIDHVYFGEKVEFTVIGGGRPQGICGSALLDTVAGLLELGIIDKRGKLLPYDKLINPRAKAFKENLVKHESQPAFLLVEANNTAHGRPIMVTQSDIRQLQLAKGAIAAGVKVLMEILGVKTSDIKEVLLAGAFGNYLTPHSACAIGLIPLELENRIRMIGNAAGTGARLALLSSSEYRRAAEIAARVEFVELGSYPKFNSIFADSTYFRL